MTAGNSTIASAFTCASEFTLTVTLVVFVMVTAVLLFIILLLCVSKSFRAFFFRDAAKRKKAAAKKAAKQAAEQNAQAIDQQSGAPTQTRASRTVERTHDGAATETSARRNSRSGKNNRQDVLDAVITVPLDCPAPEIGADASKKSRGKRSGKVEDEVPTIALPKTAPQSQQTTDRKRVYTPRTVTITRARASSESVQTPSTDKSTPKNSERNGQSRKKN